MDAKRASQDDLRLKGIIKLSRRLTTLAGITAWDQTEKFRGGGSGGLPVKQTAKRLSAWKVLNILGATSTNLSATGGYSIFNLSVRASDFFSDFFPAAIALHRGQGCSPSKVCETASVSDCWLTKLAASIVVHATVCSAAQCAPVVNTSVSTTRHFPKRASTATN